MGPLLQVVSGRVPNLRVFAKNGQPHERTEEGGTAEEVASGAETQDGVAPSLGSNKSLGETTAVSLRTPWLWLWGDSETGSKFGFEQKRCAMGLDNIAARNPKGDLTDADCSAFENANLTLYRGILYDEDCAFRGKVYDDAVWAITGITLYREWIPPKLVRAMAQKLNAYSPINLAALIYPDVPVDDRGIEEARSLQTFFNICAQRGLGIIASK